MWGPGVPAAPGLDLWPLTFWMFFFPRLLGGAVLLEHGNQPQKEGDELHTRTAHVPPFL